MRPHLQERLTCLRLPFRAERPARKRTRRRVRTRDRRPKTHYELKAAFSIHRTADVAAMMHAGFTPTSSVADAESEGALIPHRLELGVLLTPASRGAQFLGHISLRIRPVSHLRAQPGFLALR